MHSVHLTDLCHLLTSQLLSLIRPTDGPYISLHLLPKHAYSLSLYIAVLWPSTSAKSLICSGSMRILIGFSITYIIPCNYILRSGQ